MNLTLFKVVVVAGKKKFLVQSYIRICDQILLVGIVVEVVVAGVVVVAGKKKNVYDWEKIRKNRNCEQNTC